MLPPANRLRKEKVIKRALAGRSGCKVGLLACKTAKNGLKTARFCFIVSKRISNKAVDRNKLKRRLRAAVMAQLSRVNPGVDCVLVAYPGLETRGYGDLTLAVEKILNKSGVLKS